LASSLFFCKKQFKSIYPAIFTAISTLIFGVLSTTVDVIFAGFGGVPIKSLLQLFSIYYIRGIGFFVTHIISNFLIVFFLYTRLYILLSSMNNKLFFAVTKEKV
jgi:hypothetical protein